MDLATVPLDQRTFLTAVDRSVVAAPDRYAVKDANGSVTYEQAWGSALETAGGLDRLGVGRQDRVLLMLDSHADNVLIWMALALTARVEVPINTAYKGSLLAHVISDSGAATIVVEEHYLPRLLEVADSLPNVQTVVVRRSAGGGESEVTVLAARRWQLHDFAELRTAGSASPQRAEPWELISVSYTSGTTGLSKGVLCPHAHAYGHSTNLGIGTTKPGEVRFVVLPQFHIAGRWGGVYHALAAGATAVIPDAFHATTFWKEVAEAGAHTTELVGTMAEFLYRQPHTEGESETTLREVALVPLIPRAAEFGERFGVSLTTCYGSTEVGCITETLHASRETGSGPLRSHYEARIVDENDVEVPDGSVGELVVRPRLPWTTMIGYHGAPERTADVWRNGWLHSGDAMYRDEKGNYFFVDRVDDAIRRRGENVSSVEVETCINDHPEVLESAVIAVPSEYSEDDIKAIVVLQPGATISEQELVLALAEAMPYFMVPRYIQFVQELPKTPTSKVRRNVLREEGVGTAWDREAAGVVITK